jgi:hypothetical protein
MSAELVPMTFDQEKDFALTIAKSDLLPKAYVGKPQNVLVAMQWANALGVNPMTAMQQLYILDGKPTASASMIAGLVRRAGHTLRVHGDDTRAVCEIVRADDPDFTFSAVWDIARATRAGLAGKSVWKSYPAAMLKARAITEAARDACPEALLGIAYTPEEVERPAVRATQVDTARLHPNPAPSPAPAVDVVPGVIVDADGVMWEEADLPEGDQ